MKWKVTLADGRVTESHAPTAEGAKSQAEHWDRDRFIMGIKRNQVPGASPSTAVDVQKIKD